jgi:CRISPR-associated endoribonuclease Cas6
MVLDRSNLSRLYSIAIELSASTAGQPPPTLGRAIHAQVLHWFNLGDPNVASAIHDSQSPPLSVSGLSRMCRHRDTCAGDIFYFRIGLLTGDSLFPLLRGIDRWNSNSLVLNQFPFVLREIYTLPNTHPAADCTDYYCLTDVDRIPDKVILHFLSPTSFKQKREVQLFPTSELVFGSLQRRWNIHAPPELHLPDLEWRGMVTAYDLKTIAMKGLGGVELGTRGWVSYQFFEPELARSAFILAKFSFYAGVGRKVTMGMGQTRFSIN